MITVVNGNLTIPEHKRFIGFVGDNLVHTIKFFLCGKLDTCSIYRLYLTFDDGTVNYFTIEPEAVSEGVVLTWQVQQKHIFKSGNVWVQIKAFSDRGVVYHTTTDAFIVGDSAEFADRIIQSNTEFLEYEKKLNKLAKFISEISLLMPYVGDNGNWYIYSSIKGEYVDSGKPSVLKIENTDIATGSVTGDKLADGAVDRDSLFSAEMQKAHLSLPMKAVMVSGDITEDYYNSFTTAGVYQIDTLSGVHKVLVVLKPNTSAFLMQILLSFDKVQYRGIFCSEDGVYRDDEWQEWVDLCDKGMESAEDIRCVSNLGDNADPQFISYQNTDPTTSPMIRIPLSVLQKRLFKISDIGGYFEGGDVESVLQEIGAQLKGLSDLLATI